LKSVESRLPFLIFELTTALFLSCAVPTLLRGSDTAA
jgi:hypothetical protein